uniref:Uncharacterized protein n=1 Tax=Anguilla anguilla TaxID=7936 RepID=A0A0E9PQX8_ANGAN
MIFYQGSYRIYSRLLFKYTVLFTKQV